MSEISGRRPKNPEFAKTRDVREVGRSGEKLSMPQRIARTVSMEDLEATLAELTPDMFIQEDGTPLSITDGGETFKITKFFLLSQVLRVKQGILKVRQVVPVWGIPEKLLEFGFTE